MFKILLLLALASCAKLNFRGHDKSDKNGKSSTSKEFKINGISWSEAKSKGNITAPRETRDSTLYKSSSSSGSNTNGRK